MSESEVLEGTEGGFDELERQITELLDAVEEARSALGKERARTLSLEGMIQDAEANGSEPGVFADHVEQVERRNRDLEERLEKGREAAERLLARVRFHENQA
jgi:hypothetical protein